MTTEEAIGIAHQMYLTRYGEQPGAALDRYITDACKMMKGVKSPHRELDGELASRQVIAGIVVAYRMTRSEPCPD